MCFSNLSETTIDIESTSTTKDYKKQTKVSPDVSKT